MSTMTDTKPAVVTLTTDQIAEMICELRQLVATHNNQHRLNGGWLSCHRPTDNGHDDCGYSSAQAKEEKLLEGHTTFNKGVILNMVNKLEARKRYEFAMEQRQLLGDLGCNDQLIDDLFRVAGISRAVEVVKMYDRMVESLGKEGLEGLILGGNVMVDDYISDDRSIALAVGLGYTKFGFDRRCDILSYYGEYILVGGYTHVQKLLDGLELCIQVMHGEYRDDADCERKFREVYAMINAEEIRERQLDRMGINLNAPRQTSNRRRRRNNK
jgi:hypothetical protein